MEKLIFYKADLNADSPLGSPLWLINKSNRDEARDTLWQRDCRLIPPKDAYAGDAYANLLTAVHHHDVPAMDTYLSAQQLSEAQAHELYCHAFYYQCGSLFDRLRAVHPLRLAANARDTVFGDEYLMNLLKLLYEDHSGTGDSYAMFMTVLNNSSSESIRELAESRDFAVNCKRVIEFRTHQAVEFFGLLHRKGLALGELSRVHSDLTFSWRSDETIPPNLANVLQELRSLGLILHGSQHGLIDARLDRAVVEQLCN